jgi:hypothetical protein
MRLLWSCALVFLLMLAACGGGEADHRDPAFAKAHLLSAAPTPQFVVNADIGGKIVYLGCDVDKTEVKPGDQVKVTHYYKITAAPGEDYRVFTHVAGSGTDWMNIDASKMRSSYPVGDWKAGDIIKDEQTFTLKPSWSSAQAIIAFGVYKKGVNGEDGRLDIVSGPKDGHRAVIAARLKVTGAKAATPPPITPPLVLRKVTTPITIDGKADEPAWAQAASTGAFKTAEGSGAPPATSARLLYDDKNLYVFVDVTDRDAFSSYTKPDDPLWKEDVVEIFVDADGNHRGYIELQVNPNNAQFDKWWPTTRAQAGDESWSSGMVSAVVVEGTKDQRDDEDKGWHAELAIPLVAMKGKDAAMSVRLPPQPGDRWRINIVRSEVPKGGKMMTSAWAQISMSDFHAIDRLPTVVFADAEGQVPATPAHVDLHQVEPGHLIPVKPLPDPKAKKPAAK